MITFDRLLNSSIGYFPLVLCVISELKCILLLLQNFGKLNLWMQISSPQKVLTGLLPNFIVLFLLVLKSCLHCYRKIRPVERYRRSSASSYASRRAGIQSPLRLSIHPSKTISPQPKDQIG